MIPLVVCTTDSTSLSVLKASIETYTPDVTLRVFQGHLGNFGDDYNEAMKTVFDEGFDEILIANDDIVLDPNTISSLLSNVGIVKANVTKPGLVGTLSNYVRQVQNIRFNPGDKIVQVVALSPILAWISKAAFTDVQFPPLNWYSDDVMCQDLNKLGYRHYVGTAYVHHVGSSTIGIDDERHTNGVKPWIIANRPDYAKAWFGE